MGNKRENIDQLSAVIYPGHGNEKKRKYLIQICGTIFFIEGGGYMELSDEVVEAGTLAPLKGTWAGTWIENV